MNLKDKFAALLRRWASKLSPETNPFLPGFGVELPSLEGIATYKLRRVASAYSISKAEERNAQTAETHGYPDAVKRMREEYKERIAHAIVARLWEDGVVEYTEERDPYTGELHIKGSLYVGIRKDKNNDNTNPFNQ